eukprot:2127428-Karenia_brevis.AAC.1
MSTALAREAAMDNLQSEFYSKSSAATIKSRLHTAENMLAAWELQMCPLTVENVLALGASLKAGGYRSAAQYLSAVRLHCERKNFPPCAAALRAITD